MRQFIQKKYFENASQLVSTIEGFYFRVLKVDDLEMLHQYEATDKTKNALFVKGTDQKSDFHSLLYSEFDRDIDSDIVRAYRQLCKEWYAELPEYGYSKWAIQRYPSLRIHLPGNVSVFEFHRDSDYNHPLGEINHFLSVTRSTGTASLHVEEDLGWNNHSPLELNKAQSAILNTSIFKHGDLVNKEEYTRVSVDFRVIPIEVLNSNLRKK